MEVVAAVVAVADGGVVSGLGGVRGCRKAKDRLPRVAVFAELSVDRSWADELIRQSRRSHLLAFIAAGLVALSLGMVCRAAVKLAEARGQTDLYSTEARHLRELSQAAAGLAHETRNPLGLIRGWTQRLAQADATSAQRLEHAHAVIEECDRVTARINQFLAFARPRDPQITVVDVEMMLGELAAILQPDLESAGLSLKWDIVPVQASCAGRLRDVASGLVQPATECHSILTRRGQNRRIR